MSLSREALIKINGLEAVEEWDKKRAERLNDSGKRKKLLGALANNAGVVDPAALRQAEVTGEVPAVDNREQ